MALLGILLAILVPIFLVMMGLFWLVGRAFGRSKAREIEHGWGAVAKTLNCKYIDTNGTLEGTYEGATFKVDRFTITSSAPGTIGTSSQTTFTRVVATTAGAPDSFKMTIGRSGIFGPIVTPLDAEEVVVGQPLFDKTFRVKSNEPAFVRRILGAELTALFLQMSSADVTVRNGVVITAHGGIVVDPNLLVPMIRASSFLATAMAAAAATQTPAFR
jgi:hypothetical protein